MASVRGKKRGFGVCGSCEKEFSNRKKPKVCECGHELGGSYVEKEISVPAPLSVEVWEKFEGSFRSVKLTPNDDRNFVLVGEENFCYAKKCLSLRSSYSASNMKFTCKHIEADLKKAIFKVSFSNKDIRNFTPDKEISAAMESIQIDGLDTVIKVSPKTYAVISNVCSSEMMGYTHVVENINNSIKFLRCMANSCRKKLGRTKQVGQKALCIHLHLVILARQLCEGESSTASTPPTSTVTSETAKLSPSPLLSPKESTAKLYMNKIIPYVIEPSTVCLSDKLIIPDNERLCFEPGQIVCELCGGQLSDSMYPQGCNASNGNGMLITSKTPFVKIDIKLKKCLEESCRAFNMAFLFTKGLFNVTNKVILGLDILLEWREFFKDGMPISNIIRQKLQALLLKTEKPIHPTTNELEYLVETLYKGFYAFEAMTERNLDDVICGYCGIVGPVYFGDGNEKNCCSMKDVDLDTTPKDITGTEQGNNDEVDLQETLLLVKEKLINKWLFAGSDNTFSISIKDIPPIIPSALRSHQFNTEGNKKSVYLKDKKDHVEGDPMMLSHLISKNDLKINEIESLDAKELATIATKCSINPKGKSRDMLRLVIKQLYASILVGNSPCHEFVKSPGHTGGFYHFVCPHGTTVCSKYMILTESVRDAADLWLSLKYPPILFVCDTPCTFVQHVNNRNKTDTKEYWGEFHGCFEKPQLDKEPSKGVNVPSIAGVEFRKDSCMPPWTARTPLDHPLSGEARRFVCGDRFHDKKNPHKSDLCRFHNIDLCEQSTSIKTSYQESMNNKKNRKRNRSSCTQGFLHHFFYNYLMNYYENEAIVKKQKNDLEESSRSSTARDSFYRLIIN